MDNPSINIYARCRHRANLTQEQWAEALHLSVDAIRRYEGGARTPSCWVVKQMIDVSGYEALALQHICATTEPLGVVQDVKPGVPLSEAVLRLVNLVYRFGAHHKDRQLMDIAEDGIITPDERDDYDAILDDLRDIIAAAQQVRYSEEARHG